MVVLVPYLFAPRQGSLHQGVAESHVRRNYFQQNQVSADISTQFLFFSLGFLGRLILAKAC